ncbi:MAG: EamA family transporter [Micromonosporaceae bacterium]
MTLVAFALVLGAAVSHATWNLAAKRASDGGIVFVWVLAVISTVLYAPAAIYVAHPLSLPALTVIAISAVVHLGYFLLLQRGYVVGDLSVVYPLARGSGPLLAVIAAIIVLGDRPNLVALSGAALVVTGILIIGTGAARAGATIAETALPDPEASVRRGTGIGYGLAAGVLIATYTVVDAAAVKAFAVTPILFDWANNTIRTALLTPYAVRHRSKISQVWREHWRAALVVSTLGPLGYILVLYAFTLAPVSLVAPARELSIVVGTLFGLWLLREPQGVRRIFGAVLVVAGVAALALS